MDGNKQKEGSALPAGLTDNVQPLTGLTPVPGGFDGKEVSKNGDRRKSIIHGSAGEGTGGRADG